MPSLRACVRSHSFFRIEKRLRPLCVRALKRIFIMCDTDGDGAMCDAELNAFQQTCFNQPLTEDELQNVKQVRE